MRKLVAVVAAGLLAAGCSVGVGFGVSLPVGSNVSVSLDKKVWSSEEIADEVVWSGEMVVKKPVTVKKGGTLKILPGTKVEFDVPAVEHEEKGHEHTDHENAWVFVEGKVIAEGEPQRKIIFTSAKDFSASEKTDAFAVIEAQSSSFTNVVFERCGWAVHLHDTPGARFADSTFRGNYGGVRFKGDKVAFSGNLFEKNRIGVRVIASDGAAFERNEFAGNLTGIFFREEVTDAKVTGNIFANEEYDIKLGEAQEKDVVALGNTWKNSGRLGETIYDGVDSPGIGRVVLEGANGR